MTDQPKPLPAKHSTGETEQNYRRRYGDELGHALYWAWHRNPKKGNLIRAEIDRLRTPSPAREDLAKAVRLLVDEAERVCESSRGETPHYVHLGNALKEVKAILDSPPPPSKSEAEIRAEVWEEAAKLVGEKLEAGEHDYDGIAWPMEQKAKSLRDGAGGANAQG